MHCSDYTHAIKHVMMYMCSCYIALLHHIYINHVTIATRMLLVYVLQHTCHTCTVHVYYTCMVNLC